MSDYLLYGNELIKNDSTIKDFAKSLCDGVPRENLNEEDFKDRTIDLVSEILRDDISRTNINYENLMYKYRSELGDILYEIENNGYEVPPVKFFGKEAESSFNYIVIAYIDIHFDELITSL